MKKIIMLTAILALTVVSASGASLTLLQPNGGEKLLIGFTYQIQWKADNVTENIKLVLFNGNTWLGPIVENLKATPSQFSWIAGKYSGGMAPAGDNYKIRIRTISNGADDYSDAFFSLLKPNLSGFVKAKPIIITAPQANGSYMAGKPLHIAWNKNFGFGTNIKINMYLLDEQNARLEHKYDIANTGAYDGWTPDIKYAWPGKKFRIELGAFNPSIGLNASGKSGLFSITIPPPPHKVTRLLARTGTTETSNDRHYSDNGKPECLSAFHPQPGRAPGATEIKVGHYNSNGKNGDCYWSEDNFFTGSVTFDLEEIKGKEILEAKLLVSMSEFLQVNPVAPTNTDCDNLCDIIVNSTNFSPSGLLTSFSLFEDQQKYIDVTKAVQHWAAGNANHGLIFQAKRPQYTNSVCLKYYAKMFLTVKYIDYE
jgi:hypothetical protein